MISASSARRTLLPILAIVAGVACVQGACRLRSLDYLGNGHGQDGAMMDSAKRDVDAPSTPSFDTAIVEVFGQDTLAENGGGDGLAAEFPGEVEPDSVSVVGAVDGSDDVAVSGAGGAGGGEVGLGTGGSGAGGTGTEIGSGGGMGGTDGGTVDVPAGSGGAGSGGTPASGGRGGGGAGSGGTPASGGRGSGGVSGPDAPPDLAVDSVDAIPQPTGLVAYYPCESANGVVLPDQSGNGNDATLSIGSAPAGGTPPSGTGYRFEAGKVGNALTLLKAGYGYVSMPPSIFNGAPAITVALWIKVNTAQNWQRAFDVGINAHLDRDPNTGSKYFNLIPQNATSQIEIAITANGFSNEQLLHANPIVPADGWRHVAMTIDGSQAVVYVNGPGIRGTTTTSRTLTLRPIDLGTIDYAYLGKSQWGMDPYFDGQIDEVRVYRRALSATEVQTLAQFTGP